jgi:dihydroxy-acid dehydratase
MATGGSTNAVLHLIAMGRAIGVSVTIDDFQEVGVIVIRLHAR